MDHADWRLLAGIAIYILAGGTAIVAAATNNPTIFLFLGPLAGPWLIWHLVSRINRRDDPRHAKRPPDPP
jgi:hypothetical protein